MIINATLRYCNWSEINETFDVATHVHKHWEIVLYDNRGISTVDQVPYRFEPHDYVVIPSNVPHSEHSEPGKIICLGFDTDLPRNAFRSCLYSDDSGEVGRLAQSIIWEIQNEPPYYSFRINLLLRDLLLQILRQSTVRHSEPDEKLDMILNYLDAYCTTDVDFKALANSLNYSYDYLRHYFKAQKKMSLKQYVIQRRIQLAKEYLMSDMPILQIAETCGFSSAAHFAATFRQIMGQTPTQFRENCRNIVTDRNDPVWQE